MLGEADINNLLSRLWRFSLTSHPDTKYRFLVVPLPPYDNHYGRSRSGWGACTPQIDLRFEFWVHFWMIQNKKIDIDRAYPGNIPTDELNSRQDLKRRVDSVIIWDNVYVDSPRPLAPSQACAEWWETCGEWRGGCGIVRTRLGDNVWKYSARMCVKDVIWSTSLCVFFVREKRFLGESLSSTSRRQAIGAPSSAELILVRISFAPGPMFLHFWTLARQCN